MLLKEFNNTDVQQWQVKKMVDSQGSEEEIINTPTRHASRPTNHLK